jgi:hypothetical protein
MVKSSALYREHGAIWDEARLANSRDVVYESGWAEFSSVAERKHMEQAAVVYYKGSPICPLVSCKM